MKTVYVKIGTEVVNQIPKEFIEFNDFWEGNKTDKDYVLMYLDENNKIVQ